MFDADNEYVERSELEVQSLASMPDDLCNHLPCILWDMRARANLRKPFFPRPKPEYQGSGLAVTGKSPKRRDVGKRAKYSSVIMRGIYQLHRHGMKCANISKRIGMPLEDVQTIMGHKTGSADREWKRVMAEKSVPSIEEITSSISKEAENLWGSLRAA